LAEIGIFFLMFHAGVETQPLEFFDALKRSMGVAIVGAIVPFGVSFGVATLFGLEWVAATFVALTMTATAVVITLKSLKDLGLANTRFARVIVASCVIDDLLTLVFFGLIIGVLSGGEFEAMNVAITLGKVVGFFAVSLVLGHYIYPRLKLPFRTEGGKGFTFVLMTAFGAGLFAELIGLHMILGAYLAGLFFEEKVAHPNLVKIVQDRSYGIAYSFLGPIFFISLGFQITFDISLAEMGFVAALTSVVIVGQILSAGGMALRMGMPFKEALTVGVGMCGRAEMAFILASLALTQGAIDQPIFTVLILTAFILNLFTPLALKGCAVLLEGKAARLAGATKGVMQLDKFHDPLIEERYDGRVPKALPNVEEAVVIYGYGPEVDSLMGELKSREIPVVLIEEDEGISRKLYELGEFVVHGSVADDDFDLIPLTKARALIANGKDDVNAVFCMRARELGFEGPIVAMIENPSRRAPITMAGATAAFTPTHLLAAAIAVRASTKISPLVAGLRPFDEHLEVAELRVHSASPLSGSTLAQAEVRTKTGANIVGQWLDDELHSPPGSDDELLPGMILVAAGSHESISTLNNLAHPITQKGVLVIAGHGIVAQKLAEFLKDAGEEVCVIHDEELAGVDVVGDVLDSDILEKAGIHDARAVILALDSDSATIFATTVIRNVAPEVPILVSAALVDSIGRIQRAGADYVLSISQVTVQILTRHILGDSVSHQPSIKLVKVRSGILTGRNPLTARIRERTGCTVVAVEHQAELMLNIPDSFKLSETDTLFICGTGDAVYRYYDQYRGSRM
jgi:Kef-type K+ transport system membrane component KefB/Trk K+ transport system NAD-binding subunit